jgi:ABC-type Zn uptake system ZnuABC Zn-binding protein ZnuA
MLALNVVVSTYYCHDCAKVISASRVDVRQKTLEAAAY